MRNTVICQGIAARVKQGVASSGQAAQCVSSARVRVRPCLCGRARVCVRLRTGGLVMLLVCRTVSPRYAALLPMVAAATQGFVDELEQEMEEEKAEEKVQSAAAKTTSRL